MYEKKLGLFILIIFLSSFSPLTVLAQDPDPLQTCPDCKVKIIKESLFKKTDPKYKESLVIIKKSGQQDWKVNSKEDPAIVKAREDAASRLKRLEQKRLADLKRAADLKAQKLARAKALKRKKELLRKRKLAQKLARKIDREKRLRDLAQAREDKENNAVKSEQYEISKRSKGLIFSLGYAPLGSLQGTNLSVGYFWSHYSIEASALYNTKMIDPNNQHWNSTALTGKYYLKHQGTADYFDKTNYYGKLSLGVSSKSSSNNFGGQTMFGGAGLGISHPVYGRIRVFSELDGYFQHQSLHGESLTFGIKMRY